jgi:hypothetical protein
MDERPCPSRSSDDGAAQFSAAGPAARVANGTDGGAGGTGSDAGNLFGFKGVNSGGDGGGIAIGGSGGGSTFGVGSGSAGQSG